MDQQHNTATDQYHLASFDEQARRLAYAMAKAMGLTPFDRCGPKLNYCFSRLNSGMLFFPRQQKEIGCNQASDANARGQAEHHRSQ